MIKIKEPIVSIGFFFSFFKTNYRNGKRLIKEWTETFDIKELFKLTSIKDSAFRNIRFTIYVKQTDAVQRILEFNEFRIRHQVIYSKLKPQKFLQKLEDSIRARFRIPYEFRSLPDYFAFINPEKDDYWYDHKIYNGELELLAIKEKELLIAEIKEFINE